VTGKAIVQSRDIGLLEIHNIRTFIYSQSKKRTVYGELALKGFIDALFDQAREIMWNEVAGGIPPASLDENAAELETLSGRITEDAMERVAMLEKGTCP
jgi:hypothetical protein